MSNGPLGQSNILDANSHLALDDNTRYTIQSADAFSLADNLFLPEDPFTKRGSMHSSLSSRSSLTTSLPMLEDILTRAPSHKSATPSSPRRSPISSASKSHTASKKRYRKALKEVSALGLSRSRRKRRAPVQHKIAKQLFKLPTMKTRKRRMPAQPIIPAPAPSSAPRPFLRQMHGSRHANITAPRPAFESHHKAAKGRQNPNLNNLSTYLHLAVQYNNLEAVRAMIESGVDINMRNSLNERPIDAAIKYGHNAVLKTLVKAGAFIASRTNIA